MIQIEIDSRERLINYINTWHTDAHIPLISEWASQNRYLPAGTTEYPGMVDHSLAPYSVEIMDSAHPDSDVDVITIKKGTQALITTAAENVIGHSIKYKLHNILYIISSLSMAKMRSSAAIDTMIDYSGLADCMKPISQRAKKKVADGAFYKEMHGNRRLLMTSYNSIADAKSFSYSLIIMDELEEAPHGELKGQGDVEAIFRGRTKTIRGFKIIKISTPTNTQGRIHKNWLEGDQRKYFCQCPLCGELQVLELMTEGRQHGLFARSEMVDKLELIIPDSVGYICKFCKGTIKEYQKGQMLNGGKWIPTARPVNPRYRSYHISNLMSPVVFYSWTQCMQEFAETGWGTNILKLKNFIIDVLGEAWEARTEKRSYIDLYNKSEDYPLGILPEGALIVTMGTDVQKMYLQYTVVAWGRDMQSWVIDEGKFHAQNGTKDKNDRCWQDWRNFIATKKYKLKKRETVDVIISRAAIDSGYNPDDDKIDGTDITYEHTVYEMVARTPRTIACRGNWKLKDTILKEERVKRQSPLKTRYDHAINELKDEIFVKVDLPAGAPGEMHFTKQLGEEFFRGFLSEVYAETEPGKWNYRKIYERNEPLDTWILARSAAEHLNLSSWTEQIWNDVEMRLLK